jgi:hypothetical protein
MLPNDKAERPRKDGQHFELRGTHLKPVNADKFRKEGQSNFNELALR